MWCINTPFGYAEKGNMTFAENNHYAKKTSQRKTNSLCGFTCFCFFTSSVESRFKYMLEPNEIEGRL